MIGLAVIVIVNGSIVAGVPPARLIGGHVMAPVRVVASFADRTVIGDDGAIVVTVGAHRCIVRLGTTVEGEPYVPLAALAQALGGSVLYDAHSRSIALHFDAQRAVRTPQPFDPAAPRVAPTMVFTPEPRPATPRPIETGAPRPRRTAIPETPSQFPGD